MYHFTSIRSYEYQYITNFGGSVIGWCARLTGSHWLNKFNLLSKAGCARLSLHHLDNKMEGVCMDLYYLSWEGNRIADTSSLTEINALDKISPVFFSDLKSIYMQNKSKLLINHCIKFNFVCNINFLGIILLIHLSQAW